MNDEEITFSDDLLPNSSSAFLPEPDEVDQREINDERARIVAAAPLIDELVTWFDGQITAMDSISGLDPDAPELRAQIIGRTIAKEALSVSRGRLVAMKDEFIHRESS